LSSTSGSASLGKCQQDVTPLPPVPLLGSMSPEESDSPVSPLCFLPARHGRFLPKHRSAPTALAQEIMTLILRSKREGVAFQQGQRLTAGASCPRGPEAAQQPQQGVTTNHAACLTLASKEVAHATPPHVQRQPESQFLARPYDRVLRCIAVEVDWSQAAEHGRFLPTNLRSHVPGSEFPTPSSDAGRPALSVVARHTPTQVGAMGSYSGLFRRDYVEQYPCRGLERTCRREPEGVKLLERRGVMDDRAERERDEQRSGGLQNTGAETKPHTAACLAISG